MGHKQGDSLPVAPGAGVWPEPESKPERSTHKRRVGHKQEGSLPVALGKQGRKQSLDTDSMLGSGEESESEVQNAKLLDTERKHIGNTNLQIIYREVVLASTS